MEAEVITVILRQVGTMKLKFDTLQFINKGRASKGNLASKYPLRKLK
jgi:topoisomerase-4 subunit A